MKVTVVSFLLAIVLFTTLLWHSVRIQLAQTRDLCMEAGGIYYSTGCHGFIAVKHNLREEFRSHILSSTIVIPRLTLYIYTRWDIITEVSILY